jgi:hypothetical protein
MKLFLQFTLVGLVLLAICGEAPVAAQTANTAIVLGIGFRDDDSWQSQGGRG